MAVIGSRGQVVTATCPVDTSNADWSYNLATPENGTIPTVQCMADSGKSHGQVVTSTCPAGTNSLMKH